MKGDTVNFNKEGSFGTVQILAQKGPSGELGAPHHFNPFFLVYENKCAGQNNLKTVQIRDFLLQ
jgi:hypothetical protein